MNSKVKTHFKKVDSMLYKVFKNIGEIEELKPRKAADYFRSLCSEIISQQLSGKVAQVIFDRFEKLLKGRIIPKNILKIKDEDLRATGMSWSKVKFIKDLAQKINDKELALNRLSELKDEEVIVELTKVKGIGRWTAEMFLMFTLGREDVFSKGDLGLKNAIKKLYKVEGITEEIVNQLTSKWSPYRTYACLILWRSLDN